MSVKTAINEVMNEAMSRCIDLIGTEGASMKLYFEYAQTLDAIAQIVRDPNVLDEEHSDKLTPEQEGLQNILSLIDEADKQDCSTAEESSFILTQLVVDIENELIPLGYTPKYLKDMLN